MNIAFFTDGFTPQLNGVATNLEALTDALQAQGHCVTIFAPQMADYVDTRACVYRVPSVQVKQDPPLWVAAPFSASAVKAFENAAPDIVHIHTPFTLQFLGLALARRLRVPVVSTYHTLLPAMVHHVELFGKRPVSPRWMEWYSAWTCNQCDAIVAPSEKIKSCLEAYGVQRPISLIRNGINVRQFSSGSRGFFRRGFGLQADDKVLLSVGRLTADKNFGFLLDALARIVPRNPNVYLALVGQGPLKPELEYQAERLGVRRNLILTGPVAPCKMPAVYADADLFVNGSNSETFSMVTLEALAAGLPAVVTDDPALTALVHDGQNGQVVPADVNAFANSVIELIEASELCTKLGTNARASANLFSVEAQAQALAQLYRDLMLEQISRVPATRPTLSRRHRLGGI